MLWILRRIDVGVEPSLTSGNVTIKMTLQDVEGTGYEVHTVEVPRSTLADPATIHNQVCTLFDANHTPNTFACADSGRSKKAVE